MVQQPEEAMDPEEAQDLIDLSDIKFVLGKLSDTRDMNFSEVRMPTDFPRQEPVPRLHVRRERVGFVPRDHFRSPPCVVMPNAPQFGRVVLQVARVLHALPGALVPVVWIREHLLLQRARLLQMDGVAGSEVQRRRIERDGVVLILLVRRQPATQGE